MGHRARFLKFGLIGVVNTAIDFGIFIWLVRFFDLDLIIANIAVFLFAVANSYLLNSTWTFRQSNSLKKPLSSYVIFIAVNSMGLAIRTTIIYLLKGIILLKFAKLLSVVATMICNYFGSLYLVFFKGKKNV